MSDPSESRRIASSVPQPNRPDRRQDDARAARRYDELRELGRRESFRRALNASACATGSMREALAAALRRAVANEEREPAMTAEVEGTATPVESTVAVDANEGADRGDTARDAESEGAVETTPSDAASARTESSPRENSSALGIACETGSGFGGHSQAGSEDRPGHRAFEFAERFRAFADLRRVAFGCLEVELIMPPTNAGQSSISLVAVGPRRVALRFRGEPIDDLDLRGIIAELRDAGLEIVKPVARDADGSGS